MTTRVVLVLLLAAWPRAASAERIFTSGFELSTSATGNLSGWSQSTGTPVIDTMLPRSGSQALHISSLSSGTVKGYRFQLGAAAATNQWWARAYIRFVTFPSATTSAVMAFTTSAFTTRAAYVTVDDTGAVEVFDEDGQVGTACNTTLSTGTWYRVELLLDGSPSAGSDVVEFKIDGTTQSNCSASTRTIDTVSFADIQVGGNLNGDAQTTGEWYIDDVAVNNVTGSTQTAYPDTGQVVMLYTDGDGDATDRGVQGTDWDTSTDSSDATQCGAGTGDTTNVWEYVDDSPGPDAGATNICLVTASAANTGDPPVFLVSLQTLTSKGVDADDTITYMAVRIYQDTGTSLTRSMVGLLKSGSSFLTGATASLSGTTATFDATAANVPQWSKAVAYVDPATSSAWTLSAADAVEAGVRAPDADPDLRIDMIAVEVEFVANAGAPASCIRGSLSLVGVGC